MNEILVKIDNEFDGTDCVQSMSYWDNPELQAVLTEYFKPREHELLTGFNITSSGIRAYFRTK